jgi:hypothetical protein
MRAGRMMVSDVVIVVYDLRPRSMASHARRAPLATRSGRSSGKTIFPPGVLAAPRFWVLEWKDHLSIRGLATPR